jgi:hypothetical protein
VRHAELVPGDEDGVARAEARIAARLHGSGDVDAADEGKSLENPGRPGGRQRVLVVDARIGGPDHDVAFG